MSRIRTIKPEFWSNEQVMECSPNARLLFIGIWNFSDDHGRSPASARQLKALIFPGDDFSSESVRGMLTELSVNGLLRFYEHSGKEYLVVTGWHHQKIEKRGRPKYPEPPLPEPSPNRPQPVHDRKGSRISEKYPSQVVEPLGVVSLPRAHTSAGAHTRGEPADDGSGHDDSHDDADRDGTPGARKVAR